MLIISSKLFLVSNLWRFPLRVYKNWTYIADMTVLKNQLCNRKNRKMHNWRAYKDTMVYRTRLIVSAYLGIICATFASGMWVLAYISYPACMKIIESRSWSKRERVHVDCLCMILESYFSYAFRSHFESGNPGWCKRSSWWCLCRYLINPPSSNFVGSLS